MNIPIHKKFSTSSHIMQESGGYKPISCDKKYLYYVLILPQVLLLFKFKYITKLYKLIYII